MNENNVGSRHLKLISDKSIEKNTKIQFSTRSFVFTDFSVKKKKNRAPGWLSH